MGQIWQQLWDRIREVEGRALRGLRMKGAMDQAMMLVSRNCK